MTLNIKDRFIALVIHLMLSGLIIGALIALIYFVWFPNNLILVGATTGLVILVSVDLVLGPLLTFIVFDKSKSSLKFDLSCIAALQLLCLVYGAYLIYNERPILHVLADDGVTIFTISELKEHSIELDYGLFDKPTTKYLEIPEDRTTAITTRVQYEIVEGRPFALKTESHIDLSQVDRAKFDDRLKFIITPLAEKEQQRLASLANMKDIKTCDWVPLYAVHATGGSVCLEHTNGVVNYSKR